MCAWDFAGQEVYYATHQFFVTERAMVVLVFRLTAFDARPKVVGSELVAWVESLQSRAPGSKLLLVGTHADECATKQTLALNHSPSAALIQPQFRQLTNYCHHNL